MPTTTLTGLDFRIVGVFMRINNVFNDAVPPPSDSGIAKMVKIPKLDVDYKGKGPNVADVMRALQKELITKDYMFMYQDMIVDGKPFLKSVTFGRADPKLPKYTLNSQTVSAPASGDMTKHPAAAWQYYIFDEKEQRVKVPKRNVYSKSPIIKDGYRVIWRLIVTYLSDKSDQMKGIRAIQAPLIG